MPRVHEMYGVPNVTCPKCNGTEVMPDPNNPGQTIECDYCNGEGRVSPAKAAAYSGS